ncbi:hypothetical protein [Bacillus niameyensis]|uniref:hypothetical protein n=1 Tax=Bacillus niameyensis TaxID=1522308 RepID=UPI00078396CB|nr:hypothetical protein [Bacillus niameyensis]
MSNIKKIDWLDVEYDSTLSHDIRAIATVYLNESRTIEGILIYAPFSYNEPETYINVNERYEHDIKVWVKFPKSVTITDDEKRSLSIEINEHYMDRWLSMK